ncbi:spore cortex biosynthesis protein YabQ [Tepidibacillus sp. HK-1]|uniref:spore cortex biosynthesis protein YabQ n=1 Tax=Tepidibacillus sp. HK-1 TaxID=1883407 RepID=UPI00085292A6|nr:spore cortex biosynthesis protein YabQ [Tepidibacillus sp. HK-1]GBF11392.1 spore protein YabQ [Tepidibacillus sp. HK-1]
MTLNEQFITTILMIGSGFFVGMIFDSYRELKKEIDLPQWIVFIFDVSFGVFSALFIFRLLLWSNDGQLRLSILLTFIIGLWFYYITISKIILKFWSKLYHLIKTIWVLVIHAINILVIKPVILIYKLFISILTFLFAMFIPILKFIQKFSTRVKQKAGFSSFLKKLFTRKKN